MMLNNTQHKCTMCATCNYVFPSSCIEFNAVMTTEDNRVINNMAYGDGDGKLEVEWADSPKTKEQLKEDANNTLRLKYWRKWEPGLVMAADRLLKQKEEKWIGKPTSASYAYSEKEGNYVLVLMDDKGKWLTEGNRAEWIDYSTPKACHEQACADFVATTDWDKAWFYKTFIAQSRKEVENSIKYKLQKEEMRRQYQDAYMSNLMQYVESNEQVRTYEDISIVAEIPVVDKKVKA